MVAYRVETAVSVWRAWTSDPSCVRSVLATASEAVAVQRYVAMYGEAMQKQIEIK